MRNQSIPRRALAALLTLSPLASGAAQGLDLTVNHVGIAIGDVPRVIGLRLNFRDRNCEWGIWIGPPQHWNHGYGTEACRLATAYAFRELGMEKVYLHVYESNPGARRAYEKAGYKVEGTLPRDHWWEGGFVTSFLMAAYRDDEAFKPA